MTLPFSCLEQALSASFSKGRFCRNIGNVTLYNLLLFKRIIFEFGKLESYGVCVLINVQANYSRINFERGP